MEAAERIRRAVPGRVYSGWSERDLVAAARRDRAAFAEIYRRNYDAMATYLFRRTGDRDATRDLLGDVFLAALSSVGRFRWRGIALRHWLYRIATRAANRWAKRRRRQPGPLPGEIPDPRTPSTDAAEHVTHLLLSLSARHQAVLTLHYLEGLDVAEVGRVLGISPGTVKSRLSRARDALRTRFAEGGGA